MQNFWTTQAAAFSSIQEESRKVIVHPALAALIDQRPAVRILDYGCGDGSFVLQLQQHCEVHLYDISLDFLQAAGEKLQSYRPVIHRDTTGIPINYFDYVVNSLVLMTLPSKDAISGMLENIYTALKPGGAALIAITHPCFRQQKFSTFQTEFTKGMLFDYFDEGRPFEVEIADPQTKEMVRFNDYHWTLSTVINLLLSKGFIINNLYELPDASAANVYYNKTCSPYLLICCSKQL